MSKIIESRVGHRKESHFSIKFDKLSIRLNFTIENNIDNFQSNHNRQNFEEKKKLLSIRVNII